MISEDSVTDIHRRWYFTLLNPSSYKTSATISIIASLGIIGLNHSSYAHLTELLIHLTLGIGITVGGFFLDLFLLKGTPTNKISKVIHAGHFDGCPISCSYVYSIVCYNPDKIQVTALRGRQ